MAEGWARSLHAGAIEAHSAGTSPQGLNPLAVRAMAEVGVDISGHASKSLDSLAQVAMDVVVTVCDAANQACPRVPAGGGEWGGRGGWARVVHAGFDDPPSLAKGARNDDEAMPHYRRVRDEIRRYIETLPHTLQGD